MREFQRLSMIAVLLGLGLGCGGDGGGGGGVDAPPMDADLGPPGPVKVTVIGEDALPHVGLRVVFQNADSSIVATESTDAGGVATAELSAGGFVSVLEPDSIEGVPYVRTVAGVQPGDDLLMSRAAAPLTTKMVSVEFPVDSDPDVDRYRVLTTCAHPTGVTTSVPAGPGPTLSTMVEVLDSCTTFDLVVVSEWLSIVRGGILVTGTTATAPIVVTGTYERPRSTEIRFLNLPPDTALVHSNVRAGTPRGPLLFPDQTETDIEGGVATQTQYSVPGLDVLWQRAFVATADDRQRWFGGELPYAATIDIDLAERAPIGLASVPTMEADPHGIVWTTVGNAALNAGTALVTVERAETPARRFFWQLVGPYTPEGLPFPVLNVDGVEYTRRAGDTANSVYVGAFAHPDGAAVVRASWFTRTFDVPDSAIVVEYER